MRYRPTPSRYPRLSARAWACSQPLAVEPGYVSRFVPLAHKVNLLHCWRLTAVGYTNTHPVPNCDNQYTRHARMLRAAAAFVAQFPGITTELGAYKDLDGWLGPTVQCITSGA